MRLYTTRCDDCGWTSKPTRAQGYADHAHALHSCDKQRRLAESAARRAARQAAIDRTPKPCHHKQADHQHGTYACYILDRCRCRPCGDANSAYNHQRVRQQAYGRWSNLIDAEPVRQYIRALIAAGLSHERIRQLSGSSSGVWTRLMYGAKGGRPVRRVTPAVADRYLAIPLPQSLDDLAARRDVASGPSRDRIRALACLGWSAPVLARAAGVEQQTIYRLRDKPRRWVSVRTARRIAAVYEQLWDVEPVPQTPHQAAAIARVRAHAATQGWKPPMGLDDDRLETWRVRAA